jgi:hypothetical protein
MVHYDGYPREVEFTKPHHWSPAHHHYEGYPHDVIFRRPSKNHALPEPKPKKIERTNWGHLPQHLQDRIMGEAKELEENEVVYEKLDINDVHYSNIVYSPEAHEFYRVVGKTKKHICGVRLAAKEEAIRGTWGNWRYSKKPYPGQLFNDYEPKHVVVLHDKLLQKIDYGGVIYEASRDGQKPAKFWTLDNLPLRKPFRFT